MDSFRSDRRAAIASRATSAPRDGDGRVPFDALWTGFIDQASRALAPRVDGSLRDALLNDPAGPLGTLRADLGEIAAPATFEVFALRRREEISALQAFGGPAGRSIYDAFIGDLAATGCATLWEAFPALRSILARRVEHFVAATIELNDRFVADRESIADRIASVRGSTGRIRLRSGLSDVHDRGRTVTRLSFEGGGAVYYKPRPVDMEEGYAAFVAWFNARRGNLPALRALVTLNRSSHGWMEGALAQPCGDRHAVARYYRRAGLVLALADLFCGSDFHSENLVAAGDYPVVVDLETLFHPCGPYERDTDALSRTELLPRALPDPPADRYVACGFGLLPAGPEIRIRQRGWRDINLDSMAPCENLIDWTTASAVPRFSDGSTPVIAEWAGEMAAGFEGMHQFFLAHRAELWSPDGPIERAFGGQRTRFVARATRVYANVIRRATEPRSLEDSRGAQLPERWESIAPAQSDLYAVESAALSRLEVPYLTGRTDSPLVGAEGRTLAGIVGRPGLALARERAAAIDERAIRTRAALVRDQLASSRYAGSASSARDLSRVSPVQGVAHDGSTPFHPE
jgi:lantibiotic modifying enzyme